ncbi:MAG: HesA/MoeB/ThiF family protein [bacterium]
MSLSGRPKERYSRNLQVPQIGEEGQEKLLSAGVLVIGAGGLGGPILYYLSALGVGNIGIVDGDKLEISNLQRQILYTEGEVGKAKAPLAARRLQKLNSEIEFDVWDQSLTKKNAPEILSANNYDIIVDAVDNYSTRLLMNKLALKYELPLVHGAVYRYEGQASTFLPEKGPCYRCLYPQLDEDSSTDRPGPVSMVPGLIGTMQVAEVVRILLGEEPALFGQLLCVNGFELEFNRLDISRRKDCKVCGSYKKNS